MARARKPVPLDPPEVINVRERMKPQDPTIVLAKNSDGLIVQVLNAGFEEPWPDGTKRGYRLWKGAISPEIAEKLPVGVADRYEFRWVLANERRMPFAQGEAQWTPVERKKNLVFCPFAYGDRTNPARIALVDTILHMRERALGEKRLADKQYYNDADRYLGKREEEVGAEMSGMGAKKLEQGFELEEGDAITHVQEVE